MAKKKAKTSGRAPQGRSRATAKQSDPSLGGQALDPGPRRVARVQEGGGTAGRQRLERTCEAQRGGGAPLSGGDLDAAFEEGDVGEETVGGSTPTPDQDAVDALGDVVGVVAEEEGKTKDLLEIFDSPGLAGEDVMGLAPDEEEIGAEDLREQDNS